MNNGLTVADLEMFGRLGILPELLSRAGVSRVTDAEARCDYGITADGDLAGIIFPYSDPLTGERVSARLRRDHPELDSGGKPLCKYSPPGVITAIFTLCPARALSSAMSRCLCLSSRPRNQPSR
jgi:hypothetical protein